MAKNIQRTGPVPTVRFGDVAHCDRLFRPRALTAVTQSRWRRGETEASYTRGCQRCSTHVVREARVLVINSLACWHSHAGPRKKRRYTCPELTLHAQRRDAGAALRPPPCYTDRSGKGARTSLQQQCARCRRPPKRMIQVAIDHAKLALDSTKVCLACLSLMTHVCTSAPLSITTHRWVRKVLMV